MCKRRNRSNSCFFPCYLRPKRIFVDMRVLRSSNFLLQLISLVLVIMVLNVSIDPPDLLKNLDNDVALEEDVSINEMESISEVVLEKVLDIDNAVPETQDEENDTYLKKVEIVHTSYSLECPLLSLDFSVLASKSSFVLILREQFDLSTSPPPPWG